MAVERGVTTLAVCLGRDAVASSGRIWRGLGTVQVKHRVGKISTEVSRRIRSIRRWHDYQIDALLRERAGLVCRSISEVEVHGAANRPRPSED